MIICDRLKFWRAFASKPYEILASRCLHRPRVYNSGASSGTRDEGVRWCLLCLSRRAYLSRHGFAMVSDLELCICRLLERIGIYRQSSGHDRTSSPNGLGIVFLALQPPEPVSTVSDMELRLQPRHAFSSARANAPSNECQIGSYHQRSSSMCW